MHAIELNGMQPAELNEKKSTDLNGAHTVKLNGVHAMELNQNAACAQVENTSFSTNIGHNSGVRWIAVCVDARDHSVVGCGQPVKPADPKRGSWSKFEAWLDMICEATWRGREVMNKGRQIILNRGELMAARGWLAKRWNWTEKTVRKFLEKLEAAGMISEVDPKQVQQEGPGKARRPAIAGQPESQRKHNLVKVVSICNYELYQAMGNFRGQTGQEAVAAQAEPSGPILGQLPGQLGASEGPELIQGYKEDNKDPLIAREREEEISNPKSWAYNAGLDAEEQRAQRDVGWRADGTITVMNGFKAQLAECFPRVSLIAGLAAVAGEVGPAKDRTPAKVLKTQILRRFGYLEQDENGKDRRAAARYPAGQPAQPRKDWREEKRARQQAISDTIRSVCERVKGNGNESSTILGESTALRGA